jgi:alpha-pyrone synthase
MAPVSPREDVYINAPDVFINAIETAVPAYDGHRKFLSFLPHLIQEERQLKLVQRLASKAQIDHRYTVFTPAEQENRLDADGFFVPGQFASTERRMERYKKEALRLAEIPVAKILARVADPATEITHLIVTSCTGFYAPGLDLELQKHFGLRSDLERTIIGFMGCYAAFNAMKSAWHIVRSKPEAKILIVNLELCSLHLQENGTAENVLGFLQFADGCAASLVSSEDTGLRLERFRSAVVSDDADLIRWDVGDQGFKMVLAMDVPKALGRALPDLMPKLMTAEERAKMKIWAIHPGGRSILDAVQERLELRDDEMAPSREILRGFGNMSSATIMFVLQSILKDSSALGPGAAMAFGPGLTVESMRFHK